MSTPGTSDADCTCFRLRRAEKGTHALGEPADASGMDRCTMARTLKPLLSAGLICDARQRLIRLTAKGGKTLGKAIPLQEAA
ncbi:MarR family winged helix-turn-helix transcriptional regulator [Pseudoxanthomonas sp.]|uniref:MarR family winged helix-turn-helix transcriptional regulator n=1 Tax=Pseudoxanthomonas sp. TaxID=1871049 RepID=UPI00262EF1BF|nr:MarR family winged helix-turn-helix transcriptional regulator [Pseudoxanthomonas sp.]WDS35986.1 MAG: MarR family winged helix-turn-helix transcriptional regulator [Pseudoxanthomonas sp.]